MRVMTYDEARLLIKTGDLMEFGAQSLLGDAIREFTKEQVNHSAMAFTIDEYDDEAANRRFILEANAPGIELTILRNAVGACVRPGGTCLWYSLLPQFDSHRKAMGAFGLSQVGKGYDYRSLLLNALHPVEADDTLLFCSEFVFFDNVAAGNIKDMGIINGKIWNAQGRPIIAPRPGEFGQYGIYTPDPTLLVM